MDLDSMKYAQLRNLAKQLGLKANVKADKLLKAVKKQLEQQKDTEEHKEVENLETNVTAEVKTETEVVCSSSVFVNTRRGKAKKKRASDSDVKLDDEGGSEVVPEIHAHKKIRLSSLSKIENGENEPAVKFSDLSSRVKSDDKDEAGNVPSVAKSTRIPRSKGQQGKRTALRPVTPNFQKLHEANFNKMESIDDYMQRKNKRKMEPVQEGKVAKATRVSLFSPATYRNKNQLHQDKMAETKKDVFKPSVLSTRRINVRFSEAMPDNEHKRSLVKTPARMSLAMATSTPKKQTPGIKNMASASFVFTGNTSATPGTQKKPVFDLKASLSRPLSYKPHAGKLKPFDAKGKDDTEANKSLVAESRKKNYKQHRVQTRQERQAKHAEERKEKKSNLVCARRGLVMT
ncbi:nucleolar and spindle-associated protein 1-like isoform X2 [Vanacampus margaritifer]